MALGKLIILQCHHLFSLALVGFLLSTMRISLLFPQLNVSADSLVHFSYTLSQTQELIQLKTKPTATRTDLHLATNYSISTSERSGMCSQR